MSQTRDQQRFTVSEVAANWHEPMVTQRIMLPSIARTIGPTVQLADTPSPQSATSPPRPLETCGKGYSKIVLFVGHLSSKTSKLKRIKQVGPTLL